MKDDDSLMSCPPFSVPNYMSPTVSAKAKVRPTSNPKDRLTSTAASETSSKRRDTIQLDIAVSTISQEYLLEFTFEYGIPEGLHPELPGLEDTIPEGKFGDEMPAANTYSRADAALLNTRRIPHPKTTRNPLMLDMDLFNLISAPNPTKVKTSLRLRAAHEVPLLTATANRVIDMEDPDAATKSSGTPSTVEKSPLDFENENPAQQIIEGDGPEDQVQETVASEIPPSGNVCTIGAALEVGLDEKFAAMGPLLRKNRRKRVNDGADANAPPNVLRKDHAFVRPEQTIPGAKHVPIPTGNVATLKVQDTHSTKSVRSRNSTSSPSMVGSPEGIYQTGWGVTNNCRLDTPDACQDVVDHIVPPGYFSELRHMPNADFLSQYNKNLAQQVAMGSQLRQRFEQEIRLLKKARAQVARRDQRIQVRKGEIKRLDQEIQSLRLVESKVHGLKSQAKNLNTLLEAEVDIKKAAEAKNKEVSRELENLRARFTDLQVNNDQLTQQVATLQTQVTSEEMIKAAFEEFKKYEDDRVEKRCAEMDARLDALSIDFDEELYPRMLTVIAGRRLLMSCLRGLPKLESLKDALMEVIMASLHLKSDSREDAPKWIRDLRPSTSQLKIPLYPEVRDPRNLWAIKEEMLLKDAIAANVSRAEKKKKFRVVCRTHGVSFAHHARSDGIPVSAPTIAPQGLAILLPDAATQTETSEDDASPRLLRSKSLPPMYNLDWP
nr:hypothetical protein [Tanacetum cinerariifolium]